MEIVQYQVQVIHMKKNVGKFHHFQTDEGQKKKEKCEKKK